VPVAEVEPAAESGGDHAGRPTLVDDVSVEDGGADVGVAGELTELSGEDEAAADGGGVPGSFAQAVEGGGENEAGQPQVPVPQWFLGDHVQADGRAGHLRSLPGMTPPRQRHQLRDARAASPDPGCYGTTREPIGWPVKDGDVGVCVVTGGSRGIGAAIARGVAEDGYDVLLSYLRDETAAADVVAACRALGVRAEAHRADLGTPEDIPAIFDAAEALGEITALVNNAGIIDDSATVEQLTAARIRRIVDVNVVGAFLACGEAARRMTTGGIVNISSRAAQRGGAGMYVDYAASKAAVETLTVGLAAELAGRGIRVNAVSPGLIDTGIHRDQRADALQERARGVLLGRPGTPEEVAAAVRWLLSPATSYLTGAVIPVSGGR
jgi:NAD(P)-dependent dehydrogenase (short-subunit alcohol dehydrogenase family)